MMPERSSTSGRLPRSSMRIGRRVYVWLFILSMVAFVFQRLRIHPDIAISAYRLLYIAILFAMALSLLAKRRVRTPGLTPTVLSLILFNMALFLTLLFSFDTSTSVTTVLSLAQLSVAGLLVGVYLINFWDVRYMHLLAMAVCCTGVLSAITVITDFVGVTSFQTLYLDRETLRQVGILGQQNHGAGNLAIAFPFALYAFVKASLTRKTLLVAVYGIGCVAIISAIILTGTRMGVLMLLIVLAFSVMREWKFLFRPRIALISSLLAIVLFLLLMGPFYPLYTFTEQRIEDLAGFISYGEEVRGHSLTRRLEMLIAGWHIFSEYPVFGVGMGGYRRVAPLYAPGLEYAHNTYMEVLVGAGLVGFIPFAVLLSVIARRMWKGRRSGSESNVQFYGGLSFLVLLIHLFFLSDARAPYLWGLFLPLSMYLEWFTRQQLVKGEN
jgi:putative inorganic carbon (hco3(-)) transporter